MSLESGHSFTDLSALFDGELIAGRVDDPWFVERDEVRDAIQAHLDHPDCRIVLVGGGPGSGKTTLMAWLADERRDWLRYFIRRTGEPLPSEAHRREGDLKSFLLAIGKQLVALRPEIFPGLSELASIVAELDGRVVDRTGRAYAILIDEMVTHPFWRQDLHARLRMETIKGEAAAMEIRRWVDAPNARPADLAGPALIEPARRLAETAPRQRIVVLVDGLDELQFRDAATDVSQWLTDHVAIPANVRFVIACRSGHDRLSALRKGQAGVREVHLQGTEQSEKWARQDIERCALRIAGDQRVAPALASHHISAARFARHTAIKAAGNFLYLTLIARAILAETMPGRSPDRLEPDLAWLSELESLPESLDGMYAFFLLRLHDRTGGTPATRHEWAQVYRPVLGVLAVARARLTAAQLREFGQIPAADAAVRRALVRLSQFLYGDGEKGFEVSHASMADHLTSDSTRRSDPALYCDATDLATGQLLGDPIRVPSRIYSVGVVEIAGYPVLVVQHGMAIQAWYLTQLGDVPPPWDTPEPPPLLPGRPLVSYTHSGGGWSMALGQFRGEPIVVSAHNKGEVDIYQISSAVPVKHLVGGHMTMTAVAYRSIAGRDILAVGATDGSVRIRDLNGTHTTMIATLAPVKALALGASGHCAIGTDKGLLVVRLNDAR